jgi:serine/threonine protein kinase
MSQSADAERWRAVESLFDAALQRPPAEREGYLREACANDQDLYREVESLLANSLADDPPRAWAAAAAVHLITQPIALEPGRRVGPYEIVSFLAAGGMGEVYRARDTRLKRDVALKVLPESVAADRERIARFEREAELLASLNHPNIANIYGVEEEHGTRAIVMELVEGETLADRIAAHPSGLPVAEALSIARRITEALQAAHEKGIVHRDLKPANVKITAGGTVKVLDFGLAKVIGDSAVTRQALTRNGALLGTPRYMAPEQLAGDPTDARTDIYAAGLVLFEMLTGRAPFDAISTLARLEAMLKTETPSLPPPHTRSHLNYIVRRALDRRPDARYQTAAAMVADLRAEAGTMAGSAVALRPTVRLVVLPFRLLRADEETAFLEGALPEAITASLSSVRTVLVRSNSAALRFGSSADLGQVARELDVDHVLTGTILRSGDQLRVTCQLVGAPSGELRWSETVHAPVGDLFTVQDSLSRRIVRSLPLADSDDPHTGDTGRAGGASRLRTLSSCESAELRRSPMGAGEEPVRAVRHNRSELRAGVGQARSDQPSDRQVRRTRAKTLISSGRSEFSARARAQSGLVDWPYSVRVSRSRERPLRSGPSPPVALSSAAPERSGSVRRVMSRVPILRPARRLRGRAQACAHVGPQGPHQRGPHVHDAGRLRQCPQGGTERPGVVHLLRHCASRTGRFAGRSALGAEHGTIEASFIEAAFQGRVRRRNARRSRDDQGSRARAHRR